MYICITSKTETGYDLNVFFNMNVIGTIRNTIIVYALSEMVHLKPLLDHRLTAVQDLNRC
jgi:hypothetical protein